MTATIPKTCRAALACLIVAMAQSTPVRSATLETAPPAAEQSYRIQLCVGFGDEPAFTSEFRSSLLRQVEESVERVYCRMWELSTEESNWLHPASRASLDRLNAEDMLSRFKDANLDKVFVLAIDDRGGTFTIAAREWDVTSRRLGPTETAECAAREYVADASFGLVQRVFRPLLTVEKAESFSAILSLRAGWKPPADPDAAQVRPGDLLQAFVLYRDRDQKVQQIQFLPWTYLIVDSVDRELVHCTVLSGLQSPLGGNRGRRVEAYAIKLQPRAEATRLQFINKNEAKLPLAGYRVEVAKKRLPSDEPAEPPTSLFTDRRGMIELSPIPDWPLVWLYVRSGTAFLGRVPFVPGVESEAAVALPDDAVRLAAEGEVELLRGELVDAVASRAQLLAQAKAEANANHWQGVDATLERLKSVPDRGYFRTKISTIRVTATDAAVKQKDKGAQSRIAKLCEEANMLVDRYLSEERLRTTREQIDELRAAAAASAEKLPAEAR